VVAVVSAAVFADSVLYSAVVPVLPTYAEEHGAGTVAVGLLFASYAVALLVVTPLAGVVADRVGPRPVLLAGVSGVVVATALFAAADGYWAMVAARTLQGGAAGAVWTSGVAVVAVTVSPHRLGAALGTVVAGLSAGLLLGPPLAGALVDRWGFHAPFVALVALVVCCGAAQLLVPRDLPTGAPTSVGATLRSGTFRRTLVLVAAGAAGLSMLEPVLPLDLAGRLGASPAAIGLVFGVATFAHLVTAPAVGALADRRPRGPLMGFGLLVMAATLPLVALTSSPAWTAVVLVGFAVGYSLVLVPALPETAAQVAQNGGGYATAYAAFNIAYAIGMVAGPAVGSSAVALTSLPVALVVVAAALAVAAALSRVPSQAATVSPRPQHRGVSPCPD
jgi:multidrug resistance protein